MRILVYGAGAVGGYLGARLWQHQHDVTLLVRDVTGALIQEGGLAITENGRTEVVRPAVATSVPQAFQDGLHYDVIILGMKSYDLKGALDPLIAFCPEPACLITTQNGIGVEAPLIKQFGAGRIVAGSLTLPIRKETSAQLVVEKGAGGLGLAPAEARANIKPYAALFKKAGIKTVTAADYRSMKWSKALLNIVGNASAAILNRSPGLIYQSDMMFDLEVRMLREALDVMQALKLKIVDLPGYPASRLAFGVRRMPRALLKPVLSKVVATGRGEKMPSFQIDLMSGKGKSEVLFHNGAIARAGKEVGIPTPVNAALTEILWKLTRDELNWREFDGRPKRLIAEVRRYELAAERVG